MSTEIWIAIALALWNLMTSVISGLGMYMLKDMQAKNEAQNNELLRQNILLNKTREELARDYITKVEVRSDMEQIINRFDRLEAKIDRFIEGHR